MLYIINLYLFFAIILSIFLSTYILLCKTKINYMKYFSIIGLSVSIYLFGYLMEINSFNLEQMIFWNQIQYLTVPFLSTLWLTIVLFYTKTKLTINKWMIILLFFIPILTFLIRLTNSFHNFFYSSMELKQISDISILHFEKNFWYYVQGYYLLFSMFITTLLLYFAYRRKKHVKRIRYFILLIASIIPYIGLFLIMIDFNDLGLDYGALLLPISLILIFWAILKFNFLEVRQLAWENIFENSLEGMVVLDKENWIVDYNSAAVSFFDSYEITLQNGIMDDIIGNKDLLKKLKSKANLEHIDKNDKYFEIKTTIMENNKDKKIALIKTIRDITDNKLIQEKLKKIATIDQLSGINNRRHFMELAIKEFEKANRYKQIFSVLMIDVDDFKVINDKFGHAAGDIVIKNIGKLMKENLRKSDIVGRLGGEEFGVVLPNISLNKAEIVAEKFLKKVFQTVIHYETIPIKITVSIGVSAFHENINSFEGILKLADEAMYKAKMRGKNCSCSLGTG